MKSDPAAHSFGDAEREAVLNWGREVIHREARAIEGLGGRIGDSFAQAVWRMKSCVEGGGKIIVTGLGKSGLVARKIAATLNSLGSTSLFLHPVEALHGDLGMVRAGDLVVILSKSGETAELLHLLPSFRRLGVPVIAITGEARASLAREADVVLDASVADEACPLGLAPTASTAAQAAWGDALAGAVCRIRGLSEEDFAFSHPDGALGRRLLLKVRDVMHRGADLPLVREEDLLSTAVVEIARKRLGMTGVVGSDGKLVGIITDGDLKRIIMQHREIMNLRVGEVMTRKPRTIEADAPLTRALHKMEEDPQRLITCLMIVNASGEPEGVIHLHDCLQAGIA